MGRSYSLDLRERVVKAAAEALMGGLALPVPGNDSGALVQVAE